jgi:death-on-curing protein
MDGPVGLFQQGLFDQLILNPPELDSAVNVIKQDFYKGLFVKAAALYRSLNLNHPFVDGNKRTAALSLMLFLGLNGYSLKMEWQELLNYTLEVANGGHRDLKDIARWIEEHCHPIDDGSKGIFNQLRRSLQVTRSHVKKFVSSTYAVHQPNKKASRSLGGLIFLVRHGGLEPSTGGEHDSGHAL